MLQLDKNFLDWPTTTVFFIPKKARIKSSSKQIIEKNIRNITGILNLRKKKTINARLESDVLQSKEGYITVRVDANVDLVTFTLY